MGLDPVTIAYIGSALVGAYSAADSSYQQDKARANAKKVQAANERAQAQTQALQEQANAQANALSMDLGKDNLSNVVAGGTAQQSAASASDLKKRKKLVSGLSSALGI